jgi:hypothetical protein
MGSDIKKRSENAKKAPQQRLNPPNSNEESSPPFEISAAGYGLWVSHVLQKSKNRTTPLLVTLGYGIQVADHS